MNLKNFFSREGPIPVPPPEAPASKGRSHCKVPLKVILPMFAIFTVVITVISLTLLYLAAIQSLSKTQEQTLDIVGKYSGGKVSQFFESFRVTLLEVEKVVSYSRYNYHPWVLRSLPPDQYNMTDKYSALNQGIIQAFISIAKFHGKKNSSSIVLDMGLALPRGDMVGAGVSGGQNFTLRYNGPELNYSLLEQTHSQTVLSNQAEGLMDNYPTDWAELLQSFSSGAQKIIASSLSAGGNTSIRKPTVGRIPSTYDDRIRLTAPVIRASRDIRAVKTFTSGGTDYVFNAFSITDYNRTFVVVTVLPQEVSHSFFKRRAKEALSTIIPIAVVITVLTIIATVYITRELRVIVKEVEKMSDLEVNEVSHRSHLSEFYRISQAFDALRRKLVVYKSYLPEEAYVPQPRPVSPSQDSSKTSLTNANGKHAVRVIERPSIASAHTSDSGEKQGHNDTHNSSDTLNTIGSGQRMIRGTLLCITAANAAKEFSSDLIVVAAETVKRYKGTMLHVYADRVVAAFPLFGLNEGATNACRAADHIHSCYPNLRFGVATSAIDYGPMGGRIYRTIGCIGEAAHSCVKLAYLALDINVPVVLCGKTREVVDPECLVCPIAVAKPNERRIYGLIKFHDKPKEEEWLYTVERLNSLTEPLVKSFNLALSGKYYDALSALHSLTDEAEVAACDAVKFFQSCVVDNIMTAVELTDTVVRYQRKE